MFSMLLVGRPGMRTALRGPLGVQEKIDYRHLTELESSLGSSQ